MRTRATLGLATVTLLLAADAAGHGNMPPPVVAPKPNTTDWWENPGLVPPGSTNPSPGPTTPPAGPRTGPQTPGAGSGPSTPPSRRGPGSGARKRRAATAAGGWESWWRLNQEPYLVRREVAALTPMRQGTGRSGLTVDQRHEIFLALNAALDADDPEIVDSAAIALSRVAEGRDRAVAVDRLVERLGDRRRTVRQAAMLGLGVLGHRRAIPRLWAIMADTKEARALVRSTEVIELDRALAALSLGLAGGADFARNLLQHVRRKGEVQVAASAVLTLGLLPDAAAQTVPALVAMVEDRTLDVRIRGAAAVSLGRLGPDAIGATTTLLSLAASKKQGARLRESCLLGLGSLVDPSDAETIDRLRGLVRKERSASVREIAWITLGRIGARGATGSDAERDGARGATRSFTGRDGARVIARFLAAELVDVDRAEDLPWMALAAGVLGHGLSADDESIREPLADAVRHRLERTNHPSRLGALAIASGLLADFEAGDRLLDLFEEQNDATLRGSLAVALGLAGFDAAREPLREALAEEREAALRVDIATALDLLGDREATRDLLDQLADAPTFQTAVATARALSRLGDERAIARLLVLAADTERPAAIRGFAIVAIGRIAERTILPWNAPLAIDANWRLALTAQDEVLSIL